MEYVLTERFSQDALEKYFGNYRKIGRRDSLLMIKRFEFKETFPTLQVINTLGRFDRKKTMR